MWPKYLDLTMEKGLVFKNEYWFVDIMTNVLYRYSFDEDKAYPVLDIPSILDSVLKQRSYTIGTIYKRRVIIFPVAGECIIDYDLDTEETKVFHLDFADIADEHEIENTFKFRSCLLVGSELWIIPAACHHIVSINLDTGGIVDYTEWYDALRRYNWQDKYLFGAGIYHNNSIWFPCFHANMIVEFNTKNKLVKIHQIGLVDNVYSAICFKENILFALDCTCKQLYKINEVDQIIEKYDLPTEYDTDIPFISVVNGDKIGNCTCLKTINESIVGIPCYGNYFLVFSEENNVGVIPKKRKDDVYISLEESNGIILMPSQNLGKIDLLDIKNKTVENLVNNFYNYGKMGYTNQIIKEKSNRISDLLAYLLYESDT